MKKNHLLGIKIDYITMQQAVETVKKWLLKRGKYYIVTPNPEIIVDSKFDNSFKTALNESNLAIPDSPRLGWASKIKEYKNPFLRLIFLPFLLFPKILAGNLYPTTAGVDLMEELIKLSEEKGYRTAYLGGTKRVALKLFKCLKTNYPQLKIIFCSGNIKVNDYGQSNFDTKSSKLTESKDIKKDLHYLQELNPHLLSEKIDIMFVAFGHSKQEKWMHNNLGKLNTRVMIGVGGAFDYLSGSIPRAPKILRSVGLEWLFRFIIQPWRIKRLWKLPYFVYLVITSK